MSKGIRVAQSARMVISHRDPIAAQVDGEPWLLYPGETRISHMNRLRFLKRVPGSSRRISLPKHDNSAASSSVASSSTSYLKDVDNIDNNRRSSLDEKQTEGRSFHSFYFLSFISLFSYYLFISLYSIYLFIYLFIDLFIY